jgi:hypothetical protein
MTMFRCTQSIFHTMLREPEHEGAREARSVAKNLISGGLGDQTLHGAGLLYYIHHNAHTACATLANRLHFTQARKLAPCDGAKAREWEPVRLFQIFFSLRS